MFVIILNFSLDIYHNHQERMWTKEASSFATSMDVANQFGFSVGHMSIVANGGVVPKKRDQAKSRVRFDLTL